MTDEKIAGRGGYTVLTWGCQMNEDDSAQMALMLEGQGYTRAERVEDSAVILLNTCSVRAKPERKVYSKLGELRELKVANPDLVIGVCGCMAQKEAPEIRRRAPYVDLVVGTGQIDRIPALVDRVRDERMPVIATDLPDRKDRHDKPTPVRMMGGTEPKLKTFVSISYGCDKFCTFCIVPLTRGKERSRPADEIVMEVERLASLGTQQITLLGQTVNSYGKFLDEPCSFAHLLERLNAIEGIQRIRYTSPYPKDFNDDVIEAIATLPKVCEQVHMPVQVGDDELLKRMHRGYTLDQYRTIVNKLRAAAPDVALTTDLMLGFPGETHEQFENTMDFVRETRFDSAFMFAYSPREGTKAAVYEDQIPEAVKMERLSALIALQNEITEEINRSQVGNIYEVLVERRSPKDPNKWTGLNRQGKTINFPAGRDLVGQLVQVRAVKAHLWGFTGELLPAREERGIALTMAAA
ncbi:tRNA-2-methylthio-N(6)-dimethylallyladenosine synthase [Capsulimonas corticalis]|uniref:tRNA-2-methylthio-N(6)-dimethylallyladenosine synthase n=1 Tax=Capsulimonas corticalis TaxID=2219043 RepID=A0A402D3J9_9BACT|nr:tRNA (N6-isopentenyl adenosine(37)-C2)-methylthiotransferase MiaB [Capsulimonas corticalis]BDI31836.1 tRNA-2-methylthio-N(6)-dimethylallyladenosine synthase [Capsulimonas corticalis]